MKIQAAAFWDDADLMAVMAALPGARLVGGCVRDVIAGVPVNDIDIATRVMPAEVMRVLTAAGLRGVPTGIAHGTITAVSGGRGFEVTTLRRDVSTDGRHAVVAFSDDWREDAGRRDFTINSLSLEPDGTVHDFFGGIDDLKSGRLRFVGEPAVRVAEDRLRVLRYFRFFARYAALRPDAATEAALRASVADLRLLSVERVWVELKKILAAPDPRTAFGLMRDFGVLDAVLPRARLDGLSQLVEAGAPVDPLLRLAALVDGDGAAAAGALKLSGAEADRVLALRAGTLPDGDSDNDARRMLDEVPADIAIGRVWLRDPTRAALRARLAALPRPVFPILGRDGVALGLVPGPALGAMLGLVRSWWRDGGCIADRAACLAQMHRIFVGGMDAA